MSSAKSHPGRKPAMKMSDLAKIAGVSKATISRALNNSELINIETREKIQALAKKYNYRLNTKARNFRLKESLTIAVTVPSADEARWQISDPFFLELIGSISVNLMEKGHEMLLSSFNFHAPDWSESANHTINCDGMIVIGQSDVHERLNEFTMTHDALVVWGAPIKGQKYCTVGGDNLRGGDLATRHLLDQGCEKIAVIGNWQVPEGKLRLEGYRRALRNAGIETNATLEILTGSEKDAGYDAAKRLVDGGDAFDAIFALSDAFAMTAINALSRYGIAVPRDVAVVGYDDISLARYYTPSLTTVQQNLQTGGRLLVEKLLQIFDGERPQSVTLPTDLVIRNSSQHH